ncbi:MAG: GDP-mannose-dependent alpha-(1-6)-phosphatidylinositol monomannoside mannosyltransferase [candidate division WS2 bacterium]|nr:GDP-mannose-dependent alpha-(1-6)-phosphatidylinositol monomannoside mannosyltransferase [Candidatus Psychracetigena formicireducens]
MGRDKDFKTKRLRILYLQDTAMWYRRPFFKKLSEIYDIKFVFTYMQYIYDMYDIETSGEIDGFEGVKYKVLKNYCNHRYIDIAFGLLNDLLNKHYDIIVGNFGSIDMLYCFLAAKLRRKPIIFCSDVWGWKRKKSLKETLTLPLYKLIASHSDAMLVPGIKQKDYYISLGASPDNVFIMPNNSSLMVEGKDYETKEKLKERLNIENEKVILYVGRLVKQKGVEYLIKAFAKLREERDDLVLIIVGRGECKDELLLLSKNLNIQNHIYFMGFIENVSLAPYYLLCNVCVVPSITYGQADCWCYVVNEAMYCGKPVIATDAVGAAFYMVKDGINGFMVPEKDADALSKAIKKIISDPELGINMGLESKRIIQQGFTYEHMINSFRRAVDSVNKGYD